MARSFDALLPIELWHEVAPFLAGWELFNLRRTSRAAHALFSDANWWRLRLRNESQPSAIRYADQHSFAFVLDDDPTTPTLKSSPMGLSAAFSIPFLFGREVQALSIEIWFALPSTPSRDGYSGILLGAGTPFHVSPSWNPLFETWIHVDERRNLFGSLITAPIGHTKPGPVARRLSCDRWHHLVLTFEARADVALLVPGAERDQRRVYGEERVYVNGELLETKRGALSRFWIFNSFVLLGTGCNSHNASQPRDEKQWRPFKGVVDDMCVWHSLLSHKEIKALASHSTEVTTNQPVHSWKTLSAGAAPKRLRDHSIQFRGSHETRPYSHGVSVSVLNRSNFQRNLLEDRFEFHPFCPEASSSFAVEVWFKLQPEDDRNWSGGVVLGAQSRDVDDSYTCSYARPLIFVDRQGWLFASVLDELMYPCAQRLKPHRWYHVVLRYQDGKQDVFLDGVCRRSSFGALVRDWQSLSHMQVGTGYMNNLTRGSPTPRFKGWYGFHGCIREVRIWGPKLKDRQLAALLNSSTATHVGTIKHLQPVYSLQRDGRLPHFKCVQTTRPYERVYMTRIEDKPQREPQDKPCVLMETKPVVEIASLTQVPPGHSHHHQSSQWFKSMWHKATRLASH